MVDYHKFSCQLSFVGIFSPPVIIFISKQILGDLLEHIIFLNISIINAFPTAFYVKMFNFFFIISPDTIFFFPLYSMGTPLHIHVNIIFSPIVVLRSKYLDIVLSENQVLNKGKPICFKNNYLSNRVSVHYCM